VCGFGGETEGRILLGIRRLCLDDNIKIKLKTIWWVSMNWINLTPDRER
jgi:hypothetical protein